MPKTRIRAALLTMALTLLQVGSALAFDPNDARYAPESCFPSIECNDPVDTFGQWNLLSTSPAAGAGVSGISANLAWNVTQGRSDVVIGILDTGVDYDHEDLRNKIWLNAGELPTPNQGDIGGGVCASDDCNSDGAFTVADFKDDNRVTDSNGSGVTDRGDLDVFVNGIDDDGNGYVDDLSGWDSDDDDGDEFDHRFFGHGTGRAGIAAPQTNNTVGVAGVCPACPLMNVRIDDTFVHTSDGLAKGALYAIDNGADVLNMSLGGTGASRMSRGVFDYATTKDVVAVSAAANEDSAHQNFQSVFDDVITVGGVTANNREITTTFQEKAWFSNYGAHLDVMAPTEVHGASMRMLSGGLPDHAAYTRQASGTSSAAPHGAGVAALVISRARAISLSPPLSSQEVRQILNRTAEDIDNSPPGESTYLVAAGWDRWTGYGRINAEDAVDAVAAGTIPPEADINSPDWYSLVDGAVNVSFYANARRATTFDYTLEVAAGVEPASWTTVKTATGVPKDASLSSADLESNFTATWNAPVTNGLYTLRLRVTDNLGNEGEDRMAVWVRRPDPQDLPGFPRKFDGSIESISLGTADLDGDNLPETLFADGNGEVHALKISGGEAPGFPVHTNPTPNLPLATSDAFDGNAANGEVPKSYASVIGGVAAGDIDRDGRPEVLVGATDGRVYCWRSDGVACAGFPVATDAGFSRDPYGTHQQIQNNHPEAIVATPALGNLDADSDLEIVLGSIDQKLYVWNEDGSRMAPWPKQIFDPNPAGDGTVVGGVNLVRPRAILATAAISDVDGDGANEMVVGTNETYGTPNVAGQGGSGRIYLLEANGNIAPGWPVKPASISPDPVPLVAEGAGTSPVIANVDGGATKEIIGTIFLGDPTIYRSDGSVLRTLQGTPFGATGTGSDTPANELNAEGGLARSSDQPSHFYVSHGAVGDLDGDDGLDYLAGTVGNGIATSVTDPGTHVVFDHLLSAWDAGSGAQKPLFPRVIEDWQFLTGPAVAEISGDGMPEAIATSGGYWVHAFNRLGAEPAGWPKLTGHWQVATPAVADLNGDGKVEVIQATRMGTVFAWSMSGAACQSGTWRKFHHDEWNTGSYGADTRPPARVTGIGAAAGRGGVTLTWPAPGDDGICGQALRYDLRVSGSPITETSFDGARVVSAPEPGAAGQQQTATFDLQRARYVAIRAVDDAGNPGRLLTSAICTVLGGAGGETLRGTENDDVICAGGGKDRVFGLGGNDVLLGGSGNDRLSGAGGNDFLLGESGNDRLSGGRGNDELLGSSGRDLLKGGRGNDRLLGGRGRDRLLGGRGRDRCDGGPGRDRFSSCRRQQL